MQRSCETCKHHLGAGACQINLENECGAGEFEAWEAGETQGLLPGLRGREDGRTDANTLMLEEAEER